MVRTYTEAKKQLNEIWDKYLEWCIAHDEQTRLRLEAECAAADALWERGKLLEQEYEAAYTKWHRRLPFFRGKKPVRSAELMRLICNEDYDFQGYCKKSRYIHMLSVPPKRDYALQLRVEVDSGVSLSQSGPTEFHLTHEQLERFYEWKHLEPIRAVEKQMIDNPVEMA